jgi:RNA polymerase sigma-70 factor (ECF subfamily)
LKLSFTYEDPEFLKGLQQQDRKVQQWVFQKLNRRMFALCLRYISDPYQAEDVMMGGFLIVFSRSAQFTGEGNFEGWVRRIMVTQCLQFLRKSKSMEVLRLEEHAEWIPEMDSELPQNLDYDVLLGLIQKLPMGYRMVFNLFALEGYSHAEISENLGISEGASKSQLFKARGLLQQWILALDNMGLQQKKEMP